jgi:hypothetical protein
MAPKYAKKTGTQESSIGAASSVEETQQNADAFLDTTPNEVPSESVSDDGDTEELVQVKKSDLAEFLNRLNTLEADNKKLLAVADRGRMAAIEESERQKNQSLPQIKLTRMGSAQGRLVIAWRMTENESYVDNGRLIERQTMEIFYEDGSSETMPLVKFYRQQNKETLANIIARTQSLDGAGEMLRVKMLDGTELDIDLKFVN